jgi:hypothetical protein
MYSELSVFSGLRDVLSHIFFKGLRDVLRSCFAVAPRVRRSPRSGETEKAHLSFAVDPSLSALRTWLE